jgi:hypothetical protein
MTVTAPLNPELSDSPCSVAECLEGAQLMGSATVRINPCLGAPPDFETLTVGLPLCTNHAQPASPGLHPHPVHQRPVSPVTEPSMMWRHANHMSRSDSARHQLRVMPASSVER